MEFVQVLHTWLDIAAASAGVWWGQVKSVDGAIAGIVLLLLFLSRDLAKQIERFKEKHGVPRRYALTLLGVWFVWVVMATTHQKLIAKPPQQPPPLIVAENPDHARLAGELDQARRDVSNLVAQGVTKDNEIVGLKSQLETGHAALEASKSQVVDLQQELARAKQGPAVVVQGGGVAINQAKLNRIAESLQEGKTVQSSVPLKDAASASVKPWLDAVNKWYGSETALLSAECTAQAVAAFQNLSGQLGMTYFNIHQDPNVQSTFHNLDRLLGNLAGVLQKPEMCP